MSKKSFCLTGLVLGILLIVYFVGTSFVSVRCAFAQVETEEERIQRIIEEVKREQEKKEVSYQPISVQGAEEPLDLLT